MKVFENPVNGYTEEVGTGASFGVFFFGALYLAIKGLWRHVFIWFVAIVPLTLATGGVGLVLLFPLVSLIYAFQIQGILAKSYLAKGWREKGTLVEAERAAKEHIAAAKAEPWRAFDAPKKPSLPETKKCPYCAEEVKYEAIKCKHCQSDLTVVGSNP